MASLNPQSTTDNNDTAVDSDNDTQMSTQDNDTSNNPDSNNPINPDQSNNPATNIDNAANTNDSQMDDNTDNTNANTNDDSKMDTNDNGNANADIDTKANDNDNDDNKTDPNTNTNTNTPQYKYTWQWLENDGTWHDYDATTQLLLDQLTIGQKISISAGKWTYDITKVSNDSCTQLNTQTSNSRTSRRAKILIMPTPAPVTYAQNGSNNYLGNGQFVFLWQFLENDNKWKDLGFNVAVKLEQLPVNGTVQYSFGKWAYNVSKTTNDECLQSNANTNNQRDLRRILFDTNAGKRCVWQFNDDKGGWTSIGNNDLMLKLIQLPTGSTTQYQRGQWVYDVTKVDDTHATQKNTQTNTTRQYRMVMKDKDEMDPNWTSAAQTNNQNYQAGYKNTAAAVTANNLQSYYSNRLRGLFAAGNDDDEDDKPKEIIKLDPNDIQDIIMGDDINENDNNDTNTNQKKSSNPLRSLFGKSGGSKSKADEDGDGVGDSDEKKENRSERVSMSDDDRNIFNEFSKTLSRDTVQIISIQKIKENASKSIVYKALLQAKKEELKDKNGVDINKIERVLFHGTSFANIAKIVNNGFNRDFNKHHLYGKGTYFSSLASESAKYCEMDDESDSEKCVMLVCRVIIGEFTIGTSDMDGSSIPYKPDKKTQFESCVNHLTMPTIFVINRDYHAIPTHIITFKYKK